MGTEEAMAAVVAILGCDESGAAWRLLHAPKLPLVDSGGLVVDESVAAVNVGGTACSAGCVASGGLVDRGAAANAGSMACSTGYGVASGGDTHRKHSS